MDGVTFDSVDGYVEEDTFKLIMEGVTETLESVWSSEENRKKTTRQLLLKWHPDKNMECLELATAVTQHINSEMERLTQGLPKRNASDLGGYDVRTAFAASETFQQYYREAYEKYANVFRQRNNEAKQRKEAREKERRNPAFREKFSRTHLNPQDDPLNEMPRSHSDSNFQRHNQNGSGYSGTTFSGRAGSFNNGTRFTGNSNPSQGRSQPKGASYDYDFRYQEPRTMNANSTPELRERASLVIKQAAIDITSMHNDFSAENPAYEWVCFKAQQAAEKALKATHLVQSAYKSLSHDLEALTATLPDPDLKKLSKELKKTVGDSKRLYNLADVDVDVLPHYLVTREMASNAMTCASDIVTRATELVEVYIVMGEGLT